MTRTNGLDFALTKGSSRKQSRRQGTMSHVRCVESKHRLESEASEPQGRATCAAESKAASARRASPGSRWENLENAVRYSSCVYPLILIKMLRRQGDQALDHYADGQACSIYDSSSPAVCIPSFGLVPDWLPPSPPPAPGPCSSPGRGFGGHSTPGIDPPASRIARSSSVRNRPPGPRGRRIACLCRDSCK